MFPQPRKSLETNRYGTQHGVRQTKIKSPEEYRNIGTQFLSTFLGPNGPPRTDGMVDRIRSKRGKTSLDKLALDLERVLIRREWFVTGDVDPVFFSDDFAFQDPDVRIKGVMGYAEGVQKIFTQGSSRAETIAVRVNRTIENTITVTWRLSGRVNIGPGLEIKPYVVYTDYTVDPKSGLIIFQEDRQGLPGYDIVLSAFFPFFVNRAGGLLAPPAPPVEILRADFLARERATDPNPSLLQRAKDFFAQFSSSLSS